MTTPHAPVAAALPLRRNRNFNLLWLGEGVSVLGTATTAVLMPLLAVTGLGAGPGWMGALTAAAWLPWLLVGLPAGAWVDRLPARPVMIASDLVAGVALASVPAAWAVDVLTLPHLLAIALVNGVCTVFFRTAYVKLVVDIVASPQLEQANGRLFGTESAMQVVGPGVGGLLAQAVTAAGGIVLDALSFLASAFCLWRIETKSDGNRVSAPESLRHRIRAGVAHVAGDRYLRALTVIGGLSNFGLTGITALLVLYLVESIGLTSSLVGLVLMLSGVGGLLGATVAARFSRRWGTGRASTWLLIASGLSALMIPLGAPGWQLAWLVAGQAMAGFCVVAGNVIRSAWRQRYVPEALMGRVITTTQMVNFGTMPLAGVVAGALGAGIGLRATIAVMAGVHAVACVSILMTAFRPLRELPVRTDSSAARAGR